MGQVPKAFKTAKITMIDKGKPDLNDPNNYRPISLTNSISKIMEKLIKARLSDYLEHNNLISESQSGFRKNKRTMDNIFHFTQNVYETNHNNNLTCSLVFDVQKAFDKVWHAGLLFKMHLMRIPKIMSFGLKISWKIVAFI
jgi:hypothetical protein